MRWTIRDASVKSIVTLEQYLANRIRGYTNARPQAALLFNEINQGAGIQNSSFVQAGKDPAGIDVFGLRVR